MDNELRPFSALPTVSSARSPAAFAALSDPMKMHKVTDAHSIASRFIVLHIIKNAGEKGIAAEQIIKWFQSADYKVTLHRNAREDAVCYQFTPASILLILEGLENEKRPFTSQQQADYEKIIPKLERDAYVIEHENRPENQAVLLDEYRGGKKDQRKFALIYRLGEYGPKLYEQWKAREKVTEVATTQGPMIG